MKISLTGTDAIQVRESGVEVSGKEILDAAPDDVKAKAHRDAIQLIPPNKAGDVYNMQMAGTVLYDVAVRDNKVKSDGKLQCVFCSDGLVDRLIVEDNTLDTNSDHFISVSMLSGTIRNNRNSAGELVPVRLFPLRVGGNSDGKLNVYIVSFKNKQYEYAPVSDIVKDDTLDHVTDHRFGEGRRANSVYLHDFDLIAFQEAVVASNATPDQMRELAFKFGSKEEVVMAPMKGLTPYEVGQLQQGQRELKGGMNNPVIVEYFKATSYHATEDSTPWCSAVHCWVHEQAGVAHTKSAAACSWKDWGTALKKPVKGCTIVADHGNGRGHVGFYVGETSDAYVIMGGNQNDEYNVIHYPKSATYKWFFRKRKTSVNSKTNWAAGTGAAGGASIVAPSATELLKDDPVVEEKPTVPPVSEQICEMQECPVKIPEGYKAVPEDVYEIGLGIGLTLIGLGLFVIYERCKKINLLGV